MGDNTPDRFSTTSNPFIEKQKQRYQDDTPPASPSRAYIPSSPNRDIEKAHGDGSTETLSDRSSSSCSSDCQSAVRGWQYKSRTAQKDEKTAKTLIHLSSTNPLIASIFTFYMVLSTILVCTFGLVGTLGKDGVSIEDQLIRALAPAIRYELRLIKSDVNLYSQGPLSTRKLIGVLWFSPLVAIGVMLAAWTAGSFWMFTTILGEPNEGQGKEVDGRSAVRWVKGLWERWLLLGL